MRRTLLLLFLPAALNAQRDTTALGTILVTAERARSTLGSSTASVTRMPAAELARLPHATVADMLRLTPGFAVVSFDGLGGDAQLMVRGFYGGGEAEYVVVMVDGKPVDQLHTGLVPWEALPPLSDIDAIEIVRGGSSALYGSTAIAAVINVITRPSSRDLGARFDVSGGSFGTWRGSAGLDGPLGGRAAHVSGGVDRAKGFRAHAERNVGRVGGRLELGDGLELKASSHWRAFDEPGPLLESRLSDRRSADPIFRFDHTSDRAHALTLDGGRGRLTGSLGGELRHTDAIRTLPLAPGFGDTKERVADNARAAVTVQYNLGTLTLGMDLSHGTLDSKYYDVVNGDRGSLVASGDGRRTIAAGFAQYAWQATELLRFSLGSRFDWLDDTFDGSNASHGALSPKLGVNLRIPSSTHMYATVSRSFKAPTLDQLFDQRPIPIPVPPFSLTTSNSALKPQYGTNYEIGAYHVAGPITMTLSRYWMYMQDEIDFDVQTLRYINIGRSRHYGTELGLRRELQGGGSLFLNYANQDATARSGSNSGAQLKAKPLHVLAAGISIQPMNGLTTSIAGIRHVHMYLDDANTRRIPNYTRIDAQVAYAVVPALRLTLEVTNLFDKEYSSTGFPDPSGGSEAYFYPAAGRALRLEMRHGW